MNEKYIIKRWGGSNKFEIYPKTAYLEGKYSIPIFRGEIQEIESWIALAEKGFELNNINF